MSAYRVSQEEILAISGVDPKKCMRCGKCSATCPAYDEMEYHPHEFVAMVEKGEIDKLTESKSLYLCMSCMACIQRCPRRAIEYGRSTEKHARYVFRFTEDEIYAARTDPN